MVWSESAPCDSPGRQEINPRLPAVFFMSPLCRMGKSQTPAPAGEVVMIARRADAPKIREISQKEYERTRPKKQLSEKQQENLAKLVERNKARALERRATVTHAIPDDVPEDQELVIVKPKRKYVKKTKPANQVIYPTDTETETETETDYTESEAEIPLRRALTRIPPKKPAKPTTKPIKKPVKSYRYDTETTSQDDSSESESDDEKVNKYGAKIEKRLEAVRSIDQRLQQIRRPTAPTGKLSIF